MINLTQSKIKRMYALTKKQLLLQYLYDEKDTITIDEAIKEAKTKWQKQ